MEEKTTLEVTLDEARKWYYDGNESLREISLRCFTRNELEVPSISEIKTFTDAIQALGLDKDEIQQTVRVIEKTSKASAAMFKLSIVRKALNKGHKMPLDSGLKTPFPFVVMVEANTEAHKYYEKCKYVNQIGTLMINGKYTIAYGGITATIGGKGCLNYNEGEYQPMALLFPCADTDIAEYLTRQFGMLILQALYADTPEIQFNPTHP